MVMAVVAVGVAATATKATVQCTRVLCSAEIVQ